MMPTHTSPSRLVATCTIAACFALGIGGAYSGAALETRAAVAETRAAAQAVNTQIIELEASLERADASVRASAFAADRPEVATAAAAVNVAKGNAQSTSKAHEAVLPSSDTDDDATSGSSTLDTSTGVAQDPTGSAENDPATETASPNASSSPAPKSESASSTASTAQPDKSANQEIAQALAGKPESAAAARDATAQLEQMRTDLGHAQARVEDELHELDQVRLTAKHEQRLLKLDTLLEDTAAHLESTAHVLAQVDEGVTDLAIVDAAHDALAALDSAHATAALVNREAPQQVTKRSNAITAARATLDQRITRVETAHQEWIDEQNLTILEQNNAVIASHEQAVEQARTEHFQANREQVAARSNGWTGQPTGVTGSNGRLAWNSLCELDFAPGHRLQCEAATALMAANDQYQEHTGKQLVLTDSYRSYGLQVRTHALKPRTAARPGTSNHGWGMAVDMDRESANWLSEHGADFGWVHPAWAQPGGARPEWWHLEYVAAGVGLFEEPALTGIVEPLVSVFDPDHEEVVIDADNVISTSANASTD